MLSGPNRSEASGGVCDHPELLQRRACIDCGVCAEECPVDAIHYEDDLPPEQLSFQQINAEYFRHHPLEPVTVAAPTKARACPTGLTAGGTNDAGRVLGSRRRGSRCVRHRVGRARSTRSHRYQQALCSRDGEPAAGRLRRRQADQRRGRTRKLSALLAQCGATPLTWKHWQNIDAAERGRVPKQADPE